jgi:hypothetical protein
VRGLDFWGCLKFSSWAKLMAGWFVTGLSKLFALEVIPGHLASSGGSETLPFHHSNWI